MLARRSTTASCVRRKRLCTHHILIDHHKIPLHLRLSDSVRIDGFIERTPVEIIPITAEIGRIAIDAFARFGRGNHPARLNMGDCFAYACARSLGVPLLAKGGDFAQTDVALA